MSREVRRGIELGTAGTDRAFGNAGPRRPGRCLRARWRTGLSALAVAGLLGGAAWTASGIGVRPHPREIRALPGFDGIHVHDEAAVLGSFGALLEGVTAQWADELGIDFQVVTQRAGSTPLEALSERLMLELRVGAYAPTGGVLFVIETAGRRARFQVSRPLEGALSGELLERTAAALSPDASYTAVGLAALDALHHLKDHAFARVAAGALTPPLDVRRRPAFERGLAYLKSGSPDVDFARLSAGGDFKDAIPEPQRTRYAPSSDPLESAEHYLLVLADLAGDPSLPLFTAGSQVQLGRYPVAPFEYGKRYQASLASYPLRAIVEGERAVVVSDAPARGFVPILLERVDGLWRVDLVETWKNLFFTAGGRYVVVNRNNPYQFGLGDLASQGWHALDPLELGGRSPQQAIAELEERLARGDDPSAHFRLAEILFRNCFAAVDALAHYEAAARGASNVHTYVWTMAERASYLGLYQQAIPFYEVLGSGAYERLGDAYYALGDYGAAAGYYESALDHGADRRRIAPLILDARERREQAG